MIALTKKVLAVLCAGVVLASAFLVPSVSAQTYSSQYPEIFNSGTPLWFQCTVKGYGEYIVLIDPDTNPQSFGFDSASGYNLINNTGGTINGRAYSLTNSSGFVVRFPSYYGMQFKEPGSNLSYTWFDVYITDISGTTLDFIDYNGTRGNDDVQYDITQKILTIIAVLFFFSFIISVGQRVRAL